MQRKTEQYSRAWIAHHRLQYGPNWRYVTARFIPKREEKPMT